MTQWYWPRNRRERSHVYLLLTLLAAANGQWGLAWIVWIIAWLWC